MSKKNIFKKTAAVVLGTAITVGATGCNFLVTDNEKDLDNIDPTVRSALKFIFCKNAEDALSVALVPEKKQKESEPKKSDKTDTFSDFIPTILGDGATVSINR